MRDFRLPWQAVAFGRARSAGWGLPAGIPPRHVRTNPVPPEPVCTLGPRCIPVGSQSVSHRSQDVPVGAEPASRSWESIKLGPLSIPFRCQATSIPRVLARARLKARPLLSELLAARRLRMQVPREFAIADRAPRTPAEFAGAGCRIRTVLPVTVPLPVAPMAWPPRIPTGRRAGTVAVSRPAAVARRVRATGPTVARRPPRIDV